LSLNLENSVKDLVAHIKSKSPDPSEQAAIAERLLLASMTVMLSLAKNKNVDDFRLGNFTYTAMRLLDHLSTSVPKQ
jgi:hypothetical protein